MAAISLGLGFTGGLFSEAVLKNILLPSPAPPAPQLRYSAADIEVFKWVSASASSQLSGAYIYQDNNLTASGGDPYKGHHSSLQAEFSFLPVGKLVKAYYAGFTFVYREGFHVVPHTLLLRGNNLTSFILVRLCDFSQANSTTINVCVGGTQTAFSDTIFAGANIVEILPNLDPMQVEDLFLYEVRISISYSYLP